MDKYLNENKCGVLVVGAGIAGLMAARYLHQNEINVIVVERDERVGGRIVTEHLGGGWADIGAQFFTVRDPFFQTYVDTWLKEALIFEWSTGWANGMSSDMINDGHPRYAAYAGLNAICRRLAQDVTVHKSVHIASIRQKESGWTAVTHSGEQYHSQALILTPPAPQSLALLKTSDVMLTAQDQAALERIQYAPCLTAVFLINGETRLPEPGAFQQPTNNISWITDNKQKGISPEARTVTLHISPDTSKLWWLSSDDELKGAMRREVRPYLTKEADIQDVHIHRWQYALPTTLHPEATLLAESLPPLAFAGDAFDGPRVEGAALSGLAAGKAIKKALA